MIHDPQRTHDAAEGQGERVAKALARAGVASRREVERLIEAGRVALNGQVLTSPAVKVEPGDILTVDGEVVSDAEPVRVFRYHKPTGLVTSHKDPQGRPTVFDALPPGLPRLISVGRLDLNTEGLLLLTNDGGLARALELPATGVVRRYRARAHGRITQDRLDKLKDGITVEGVRYGSIDAKIDKAKEGAQGANVWITLTLAEGKNREVRRVLEAIGLKVNRLIRLAYGPFALGTLEVGQVEEVGPRVIREQLADHILPENLPRGDRPQWSAPKSASPGGRRERAAPRGASGAPRETSATAAEAKPKPVYKAGWAKPKIAASPHKGPVRKARPAAAAERPVAPKPGIKPATGGKRTDGRAATARGPKLTSAPSKGAPARTAPPRSGPARPSGPRGGAGPKRRG